MTTALSSSSYNNNHSAGFTLIELMVTIAVLAIIVSIAAPNISTQLANQRVKATTATLVSALKEAKAESVIRRQSITLVVDQTNKTIELILSLYISISLKRGKSSGLPFVGGLSEPCTIYNKFMVYLYISGLNIIAERTFCRTYQKSHQGRAQITYPSF